MQAYLQHTLLTTETVSDYIKSVTSFFPANAVLRAEEIGDGNINYVFRVIDENTGRSLVVKQADKVVRSSGRPLDLLHNKIEAEMLGVQKKLSPRFIPDIYHYNETMCALCMEDISAYKNTRTAMIAGVVFPTFAEDITDFMAESLLPTTDLVMDGREKKRQAARFTNPDLCEISERLVFTQPYEQEKSAGFVLPENREFIRENIWENSELIYQAALLRERFMNFAQALIHGDLHTGSIFAKEDGLKIIDPEFAFYGPMGYDVGNVVGNLMFARAYQAFANPQNTAFASWADETIAAVVDLFREKLGQKYDELVTLPMYKGSFKDCWIAGVCADTLGYAGTEIIRRIVGVSKVAEVTGISDAETRAKMERALLTAAISLVTKRNEISGGCRVAEILSSLL